MDGRISSTAKNMKTNRLTQLLLKRLMHGPPNLPACQGPNEIQQRTRDCQLVICDTQLFPLVSTEVGGAHSD
jgi:hypothetical protein